MGIMEYILYYGSCRIYTTSHSRHSRRHLPIGVLLRRTPGVSGRDWHLEENGEGFRGLAV